MNMEPQIGALQGSTKRFRQLQEEFLSPLQPKNGRQRRRQHCSAPHGALVEGRQLQVGGEGAGVRDGQAHAPVVGNHVHREDGQVKVEPGIHHTVEDLRCSRARGGEGGSGCKQPLLSAREAGGAACSGELLRSS